jgi:hypothetical protein
MTARRSEQQTGLPAGPDPQLGPTGTGPEAGTKPEVPG